MRRFTRTPYVDPEGPERREVRGTLKLGETVIIEVPGGADGDLRPGVVAELAPQRGSRNGPFIIEDVQAGDWVAVDVIDIEVGPYGYCENGGPFRGPLRTVTPVRDGLVHFPPDFVVPARPMIGVMQLEPVSPHPAPWNHGGNMDYNSIRPGSTVHIRAQREGGYFYVGDVHARMGDGELSTAGIEIDAALTLRIDRSPGFPTGGPVVETEDEILTSGVGANWEEALKIAWTDMVGLVVHRYDTTVEHANRIVGTIGDIIPGYAAGALNTRGFAKQGAYVTCQMAITKDLRRTGAPFEP